MSLQNQWALVWIATLAASGAIVWTGLNLPPVECLIRYGLPPAGAPTGRMAVFHRDGNLYLKRGFRFYELSPGYFLQRRYGVDPRCKAVKKRIMAVLLSSSVKGGNAGYDERAYVWRILRDPVWIHPLRPLTGLSSKVRDTAHNLAVGIPCLAVYHETGLEANPCSVVEQQYAETVCDLGEFTGVFEEAPVFRVPREGWSKVAPFVERTGDLVAVARMLASGGH